MLESTDTHGMERGDFRCHRGRLTLLQLHRVGVEQMDAGRQGRWHSAVGDVEELEQWDALPPQIITHFFI